MKNLDIRIAVKDSGLTYKRIAQQIGISQEWLSRIMSQKLSKKNRERILAAIEAIKKEEAENDE